MVSDIVDLHWLFWYEWVDTMLNKWMQCWIYRWKLARFTERLCIHYDSVPGDSHFRCGSSTFTQDAMRKMALIGPALWWRYVMRNARIVKFFYNQVVCSTFQKNEAMICYEMILKLWPNYNVPYEKGGNSKSYTAEKQSPTKERR